VKRRGCLGVRAFLMQRTIPKGKQSVKGAATKWKKGCKAQTKTQNTDTKLDKRKLYNVLIISKS
jgi:hypothetical protein